MLWLAICFLAIALLSCETTRQPPLRLGLLVWPPFELGVLAQELTFFDPGRVMLVDYWSPADAARDFQSGSLDVVALTLNYALDLASVEPTTRIIALIDESVGGDTIMAREGIETVKDLAGRRVGVEASALGAYVLLAALEQNGLDRSEIEIVSVDLLEQENAFRSGDIDAVTTYEPIASVIRDLGGRKIFDSTELGGEIVDALLSKSSVISRREKDVQHLVDGWFRAQQHLTENPAQSAKIMAAREDLEPGAFLDILHSTSRLFDRAQNRLRLTGSRPPLLNLLERVSVRSRRFGLLTSDVPIETLVDARFVDTDIGE